MTDKELWEKFKKDCNMPDCEYQSCEFGFDADWLVDLVIKGEKTATASNYILYEIENEPLPAEGVFNVVLNSKGQAVCIIQTTKVYIVPFNQVSAEHAYKEGEGDKSLLYWRKGHKEWFKNELENIGLEFNEEMNVVCEEFQLVYKA